MICQLVPLLVLFAAASTPCHADGSAMSVARAGSHTYESRIRLNGRVSKTRVQASDAGQARKLVQAQFGPTRTVLSVKVVR